MAPMDVEKEGDTMEEKQGAAPTGGEGTPAPPEGTKDVVMPPADTEADKGQGEAEGSTKPPEQGAVAEGTLKAEGAEGGTIAMVKRESGEEDTKMEVAVTKAAGPGGGEGATSSPTGTGAAGCGGCWAWRHVQVGRGVRPRLPLGVQVSPRPG